MLSEPQLNPQLPPEQVADPPGGAGQACPHEPQFWGSLLTTTHCPLQSWAGDVQLPAHLPLEQTWPVAHCVAQSPQWVGSDLVLTQAPPQSARPPAQLVLHTPATQLVMPPEGGAEHTVPQSPQCAGSLEVLTQVPLQAV